MLIALWVGAGVNCGPIPGQKLYLHDGTEWAVAERADGSGVGVMATELRGGDCLVTMTGWRPETARACNEGGCSGYATNGNPGDTACQRYVAADPPN